MSPPLRLSCVRIGLFLFMIMCLRAMYCRDIERAKTSSTCLQVQMKSELKFSFLKRKEKETSTETVNHFYYSCY